MVTTLRVGFTLLSNGTESQVLLGGRHQACNFCFVTNIFSVDAASNLPCANLVPNLLGIVFVKPSTQAQTSSSSWWKGSTKLSFVPVEQDDPNDASVGDRHHHSTDARIVCFGRRTFLCTSFGRRTASLAAVLLLWQLCCFFGSRIAVQRAIPLSVLGSVGPGIIDCK